MFRNLMMVLGMGIGFFPNQLAPACLLWGQDELRNIWIDTQTDEKRFLHCLQFERPPSKRFKAFAEALMREAFEIHSAAKMELPKLLNYREDSKDSANTNWVYSFGQGRNQVEKTNLRMYSLLLHRKQTIGHTPAAKRNWQWEYVVSVGTLLDESQQKQVESMLTRLVSEQDRLDLSTLKLNIYWQEPTSRAGSYARDYRIFMGHSKD